MTKSNKPIVSVRDVSFTYGYETVLKNISLDIYPHDYLAVIGPNGGGKTTLVKIILGLLKPDSGQVVRAAEDLIAGGYNDVLIVTGEDMPLPPNPDRQFA